jgi:alpha-D-xyloside xylohydrolase
MVEVIHTPYGQEHPYEQLPEERFPRQPLAREPFTVGIATRPAGAAQTVTVLRELDGEALPPLAAVRLTEWKPEWEEGVGAEFLERIVKVEQDVWQATLTAPETGHTLRYWVEADGVRSEAYTVRGESWQEGGGFSFDGATMRLKHGAAVQGELPTSLIKLEWLTDGTTARRVRLSFTAVLDERFFGTGERFNALDQRGNVLDVRLYEQYKNQGKRTYLPIPFLLSSAGYGVWVKSSRWMQFDLVATSPDCWTLEADLGTDEALDIEWMTGDPLEIVAHFTQTTGPAVLPPLWSFGLWMSANEWNTQARVIEEAQATLDYDIPASVLVIEAWSDETTFYIWNDAQYQAKAGAEAFHLSDFTFPAEGKWTDPKGMTDWLHGNGIKLLLWQIPTVKVLEAPHAQHEADRAYFEGERFGVREPDGSPYKVRPFWFRGGYLWDVTNPPEREWWLNKRAYLLDEVGIDGFKTDGGEHLWSTEVRFADGRGGDEVWNEYPRLYSEAYFQFANRKREAVTFSRAGYTGSQRAPLHWAGDENSTWDAFRHSILAGLSAGISGIPFWGWDIGGFSGTIPTAELYLRAAAMAAFCPVMQYHSEYNPTREVKMDRTPWNMQARTGDERILPVFRSLVNTRLNLMPYIWEEAQHSATTGEPMMRALRLWYAEASDYQYFFGRSLLVCPVTEPGVTRWSCFLPPGEWADLWTGATFTGGQTVDVDAPIERIPVVVRRGAEIPVRLGDSKKLGEKVDLSGEGNGMLRF